MNIGEAPLPHRVSTLYFMAWDASTWMLFQRVFRRLVSRVDGVERQVTPWPDWAITTRIDASDHWPTVWRAVRCHGTQMALYGPMADLTPEEHRPLWGHRRSTAHSAW